MLFIYIYIYLLRPNTAPDHPVRVHHTGLATLAGPRQEEEEEDRDEGGHQQQHRLRQHHHLVGSYKPSTSYCNRILHLFWICPEMPHPYSEYCLLMVYWDEVCYRLSGLWRALLWTGNIPIIPTKVGQSEAESRVHCGLMTPLTVKQSSKFGHFQFNVDLE